MNELELTGKESFNEQIERDLYLDENEHQSISEIRYQNIVYQNTISALISGAELTARDGKTKWSISGYVKPGMTGDEIYREASILASYVVG